MRNDTGSGFDLFDFLPLVYRQVDAADGSFQAFVWGFNQIWGNLLTAVESIPGTILDPNTTPLLDQLAAQRGNPFQCLSDTQLRKVIPDLIYIYQRRGSVQGIISAVRFILGINISITQDFSFNWKLGTGILGFSTVMTSRTDRVFQVMITSGLTPDIQVQITAIIQFMKPVFMRFRLIPLDMGQQNCSITMTTTAQITQSNGGAAIVTSMSIIASNIMAIQSNSGVTTGYQQLAIQTQPIHALVGNNSVFNISFGSSTQASGILSNQGNSSSPVSVVSSSQSVNGQTGSGSSQIIFTSLAYNANFTMTGAIDSMRYNNTAYNALSRR